MPKDTPAKAPEPSRLEVLRAKFAELQARIPDLKLVRVEPSAEAEQKGYVLASWSRTRVSQVCEGAISPDDAERLVLESTCAHLTGS